MMPVLKRIQDPRVRPYLHALLIFIGTIFMVHEYVFPLDGFIPLRGDYLEDSGQMTWNLWFVTESVSHLKNPFVTDMVFYPVGTNLAAHTLVSGWFPIALMTKMFSGFSDYYPIYAFNIVVLLSFFFLAAFTFFSLRKMGFDFWPSIIPAWGYAFCSFYYWHWKHLNLVGMFTLPIVFFLGQRLWLRPGRGRTILFSVAMGWSVYITEMSVFSAMALALFSVLALLVPATRKALFAKLIELKWTNTALSIVIFLSMVSPFLYYYSISEVTKPSERFFSWLSTNAASLFLPERGKTTLYGDLFEPLASQITKGLRGREAFLGIPIILFLIVGLAVPKKNAYYWFSFVLGLFFISLGFGPTLKWLDVDTGFKLPYNWLMQIPPFTQNRCPVRITLIGTFFLMPIVGFGLQQTSNFISRKLGKGTAAFILVLLFAWTVAEKYTPPPQERVRYEVNRNAIEKLQPGPVISVPIPSRSCNQAVFQTFHQKPTANFCHARTTKLQQAHMRKLRNAFSRGPTNFEGVLNNKGISNVLVDQRLPFLTVEGLRETSVNVVELTKHPKTLIFSAGVEGNNPNGRGTRKTLWKLKPGETVALPLLEPAHVSAIEILAPANERVVIHLFSGDNRLEELELGAIRRQKGLKWKIKDLESPGTTVDKIEFMGKGKGSSTSNISALVLTAD